VAAAAEARAEIVRESSASPLKNERSGRAGTEVG